MPAPGSTDIQRIDPSGLPKTQDAAVPVVLSRDVRPIDLLADFDRPALKLDAAAEAVVADYFGQLGAPGVRGVSAAIRHPRRTAAMLAALGELPQLFARPVGFGEGLIVRAGLIRKQRVVRAALCGLTAVLVLPDEVGEYAQGHGKAIKGVRNRINAGKRAGITWRAVDAVGERLQLVELADAFERTNPREAYRVEQADNADLLDVDLWLLASDASGTPLLLAVLAVDGEWATMRYFRTVTHSDDASLSRWLMAQVAVETLVARGVRYLADTSSPITLEPGLRYYQRLVGFRLYRVRVES